MLALLKGRVEGYRAARIPLDPAAFGELKLTAEQFAALTETLRFNGVVDAEGVYRDKAALAALDLAELGIALEFHPVRRIVLAAMKAQLAAAKAEMHLISPDDFAGLADEAMAARVLKRLEGEALDKGRIREEVRHEFDDAEGTLDLGRASRAGTGRWSSSASRASCGRGRRTASTSTPSPSSASTTTSAPAWSRCSSPPGT
nr:hypothetical protein GCM10020093_007940 [Planobispora longispora]